MTAHARAPSPELARYPPPRPVPPRSVTMTAPVTRDNKEEDEVNDKTDN